MHAKALIMAQLFVVDNASASIKSVEMVENEFPQANIIANSTDIGISKANNQALKLVTGELYFSSQCGYNLLQGFAGKDGYLYG